MSARIHIQTQTESSDDPVDHVCGPLLTMGRGSNNDVHLSDPTASRNHALIRRLGDGNYYLVDMGSSNGTFVNGQRIVTPHALEDADQIQIGDCLIVFMRETGSVSSDEFKADSGESTTVNFGATLHRITVLVTDIRGFSEISEQMPARRLAELLGQWFARIAETVQIQQGVIDKFIGDAVMVRWLVEARAAGETVMAALRTAMAMDVASRSLQEEFPDLPGPLRVGVGINTGEAVVGTVGTAQAGDYTAVGDSVNLAFALESSTKKLGSDVVLGQESYALLPPGVYEDHLKTISVKGKKGRVTVCSLTFEELAALLP